MDRLISRESLFLGAAIAGVTFVLTFIVGVVSGVSLGLILLRCLLFSFLLFVLGAVLGVLLQNFVPDVWESGGGDAVRVQDTEQEEAYTPPAGSEVDMTVSDTPEVQKAPVHEASLSMPDEGEMEEVLQPLAHKKKDKVVGEYRIIDDKQFPDDPQQYAKAVRTMLKRDD